MAIRIKPPKSSMYLVTTTRSQNAWYYVATIILDGKRIRRYFDNERDAGKCVDMNLIARGLEPRNVLKRLNNK
jgi:hypothetical protein